MCSQRHSKQTSAHYLTKTVVTAARKTTGKGTKAYNLVLSETGEIFKQYFSSTCTIEEEIRQINSLQRLLGNRIETLFIDNATPEIRDRLIAETGVDYVLQVTACSMNTFVHTEN